MVFFWKVKFVKNWRGDLLGGGLFSKFYDTAIYRINTVLMIMSLISKKNIINAAVAIMRSLNTKIVNTALTLHNWMRSINRKIANVTLTLHKQWG